MCTAVAAAIVYRARYRAGTKGELFETGREAHQRGGQGLQSLDASYPGRRDLRCHTPTAMNFVALLSNARHNDLPKIIHYSLPQRVAARTYPADDGGSDTHFLTRNCYSFWKRSRVIVRNSDNRAKTLHAIFATLHITNTPAATCI